MSGGSLRVSPPAAEVGTGGGTDRPGSGQGVALLADARALMRSGIGRYLRTILLHLREDPRFSRISLLGCPDEVERFAAEAGDPRLECIPFAHGLYSAPAQLHWAALRARGALGHDVAFFPHFDAPVLARHPRAVVTVQDLTHFKMAELVTPWKRRAAGVVLRRAVRGAARVLVSSDSTRRDLLEREPAAREKLVQIPFGVDAELATLPRAAGVGGIDIATLRPYLLCVGNRKPHKNFAAAVEVLAKLPPEIRLVIVGERFPEGDGVTERARALGVAERVVELDRVDDAELRGLYAGAECLLFPSLYEGFGLPVLESMALGVPVIGSDRASVPEVIGDAGVVCAPRDAEGMAAAVRRMRAEPAARAELVRRGRERAAAMTWRRTAQRTADLLCEVAGAAQHAAAGR